MNSGSDSEDETPINIDLSHLPNINSIFIDNKYINEYGY